ncbi:hypothetical protein E2C01_064475 [Portunus trituberculatus]|uniref:Uncharacterized protein n=1 Tax=Portunus trituberculatus TaxID=210409 RepID=A0A5B7HJ66_PORTR|nr:hypothetical protein [Portunus trituberculatus]
MQRPGQAGPAGVACCEGEMVPASAADSNTATGGCHVAVPASDKEMHDAPGTSGSVYGGGVSDSQPLVYHARRSPHYPGNGGQRLPYSFHAWRPDSFLGC